ncbi:transporter substrate-binding domain-containing protein, partial [Bacillus altitudinis]|uniref:transporter substrate-binding domain-containing protein n=1 Tax=Bacillus altitudinis TaxID=293387 RepID=UPI0011A31B69
VWKWIEDKGVLRMGREGRYAALTFDEKKRDKLSGYDVEVMTEVGKGVELKAEFKEREWERMFGGVNCKGFDVVGKEVGKSGGENEYDLCDK